MSEIVQFENVGLRYGLGPEILQDISFRLEPSSFHFLIGPSGAGKSSLLKLMYLAHRPTRGKVSLFGRNISTLPRKDLPSVRRRIGVVFQEFRLLNHLSAFDNVALPLRVTGLRGADIRKHVEELLSWVGLKDHLDSRPPTLSGGQQQRVAIARAVIADLKYSMLMSQLATSMTGLPPASCISLRNSINSAQLWLSQRIIRPWFTKQAMPCCLSRKVRYH